MDHMQLEEKVKSEERLGAKYAKWPAIWMETSGDRNAFTNFKFSFNLRTNRLLSCLMKWKKVLKLFNMKLLVRSSEMVSQKSADY